jgi:hypothetical protein
MQCVVMVLIQIMEGFHFYNWILFYITQSVFKECVMQVMFV